MEVDWAGFRQVVEVLDGVPVYLEHPVSDPTTGLWLVQTGCIVIDPPQALAYTRSRHFRWQDANAYSKKVKWQTDPTGDLGRITRQQDFIRRAAQRAIDQGLRNPSTAYGLVNAGLDAVKVDKQLNIGQVLDLLSRFRNFAVDDLVSEQLPTESAGSASTVSYQNVLWKDAAPLLDEFRGQRAAGEVTDRPTSSSMSPPLRKGPSPWRRTSRTRGSWPDSMTRP